MKIQEAMGVLQASTVQAIQSQQAITAKVFALQNLVVDLMNQLADANLNDEQTATVLSVVNAVNSFETIGNNIVIPVETATSTIN